MLEFAIQYFLPKLSGKNNDISSVVNIEGVYERTKKYLKLGENFVDSRANEGNILASAVAFNANNRGFKLPSLHLKLFINTECKKA